MVWQINDYLDKQDLPDIFEHPAASEYFLKFFIYSRNPRGEKQYLLLYNGSLFDGNPDHIVLYCDKAKVGEILDQAVKRSMLEGFGIRTIGSYFVHPKQVEYAPNRFGKKLPRYSVDVWINEDDIVHSFRNLHWQWIDEESLKILIIQNAKSEHPYEALRWIKNNNNPNSLAGEYLTKEQALVFVQKLYAAGAEYVAIDGIDDRDITVKSEGGPTADSLLVVMPTDQEKRKKLFEIWRSYDSYSEKTSAHKEIDNGQKLLTFWWD